MVKRHLIICSLGPTGMSLGNRLVLSDQTLKSSHLEAPESCPSIRTEEVSGTHYPLHWFQGASDSVPAIPHLCEFSSTFKPIWEKYQKYTKPPLWTNYYYLFILYKFIYFNWRFNYFTVLYWFCHTSTWIHHRYTRVPNPEPPSLLPPRTIPLGRPSAPASSIQYHASNLDWWLVSYTS